jgi:glyoxylase-like metal-dependent hydrolase (beta-lactamase superfamily II)
MATKGGSSKSAVPAPSAQKGQSLTVHVFRVEEGLGNACLLQFPDETCGILDWGTQRTEPLDTALNIAGKAGIRFVAASHAHADHTLGLPKLLRECKKRKSQ